VARGRRKLDAKRVDLVVANDVTQAGAGFEHDTNAVTIITRERDVAVPLQARRRSPTHPRSRRAAARSARERSRDAVRAHLEFYASSASTASAATRTGRAAGDRAVRQSARPSAGRSARALRDDAPARRGRSASRPLPRRSSRSAKTSVTASAASCTHRGRKQIVYGVGNPSADLMFVGERRAPTRTSRASRSSGRAGQLLTKIIEAMGYTRRTSTSPTSSSAGRPATAIPEPDEVASCQPFLFRQIEAVQAEGDGRARHLRRAGAADTKDPIGRLRGRAWPCRAPARADVPPRRSCCAAPERKRDTWDDMKAGAVDPARRARELTGH
jgi:DNA polymerase